MKDTKTLLLLFVSILLLLVSVLLLWTWATRISPSPQVISPVINSTPAIPTRMDSIRQVYQLALVDLDRSIDSVWSSASTVKEDLAVKLASFYKLRTEITALFNQEQTEANVHLARIKIMELQDKISELRLTNSDIERENKRLLSVIQSLSVQQSGLAQQANTTVNPVADKKAAPAAPAREELTASDLQLAAIMEAGEKEVETTQANATSKLVGSLLVKNNSDQNFTTDMIIVVLQPDGSVLQKSTWESGSFETVSGKQIYSCKLRANCDAGEAKRLLFTLSTGQPQKGNYTMQVYHKGKVIGKVMRPLS